MFALAADVSNMSGDWVLNTKESKWGQKKRAPQNVTLHIDHNEPKLKYNGDITQDVEGQRHTFTYDGAIDGKEYRVKEDDGERKIVIKRKNGSTIESTLTSLDGNSVETDTTSISSDGKRLTRRVTMKAPEGNASWVEVYDKR
jgi:hypothetical protein